MKKYIIIISILFFGNISKTYSQDSLKVADPLDFGFNVKRSAYQSTASVSSVGNDKLQQSSALNLQNALYGQVLGLSALQKGGFEDNNAAQLSIRGIHSLDDNDILILVDGFERPINYLTVEEVESVQVLKDAAAVALYGMRGINGVINVITKRGLKQSLDVKIRYDHGFQSAFRIPDMVDSYTYANALNEARANDGLAPRYNAFELDAFRNNTYPYVYPNVNWQKEVLKDNASTNTYNVSLRGGDDKVQYFTMFNLNTAYGMLKNADCADYSSQLKFSQGNIRTNLDIDLSPSTKIVLNMLGIFYESNRPATIGANDIMSKIYQIPSAAFPVKTEDGYWGGDTKWNDDNPVANIANTGYGKNHGRSLYADFKITQKLDFILPGLSASVRLGYDNYANYWEKRITGFEYASDRYVFDDAGSPIETVRVSGGNKSTALSFSKSLSNQWRQSNADAVINYQKVFGAVHHFDASLIYSTSKKTLNEQNNTYYYQSFASAFHYDFNSRYLADLVLMYTGSNRLAYFPHQYAFSPVLSAAWVVSQEKFMKRFPAVNYLKLRASAGIIPSDYTPELNLSQQAFSGGGSYYFMDNYVSYGGTKEGHLATKNLKTEKAYKYNAGIDATLFNSLSLTAEVYYQLNTDIILSQSGYNSAVLGVSSPYVNAGRLSSKGYELEANYTKKYRDISFYADAKYTFTKDKVIENLQGPVAYPYLDKRGHSKSQCYGLQTIGFYNSQQEIDSDPVTQTFATVRPGDIRYKDQNGDNRIDENDVVAIGYNNYIPEKYYSLDLGFEYRGIGFNVSFQGVGNFSKFLTTSGIYRPMTNNISISQYYYDNRWTAGADNANAKYPRLSVEDNKNNNRNSTVWLADASYLKLRNCELYYNLPASILKKSPFTKAKIYVRGMNLLSWDKIDIMDPENTGTLYPTNRSVNAGFLLNF